jgi:hypothetical protein
MRPLLVVDSPELVRARWCAEKVARAGRHAPAFSVRCMRSWAPLSCGLPGPERSSRIPSFSGQTELLERRLEAAPRRLHGRRLQRPAAEQVARVAVQNRERVAELPVPSRNYPLKSADHTRFGASTGVRAGLQVIRGRRRRRGLIRSWRF